MQRQLVNEECSDNMGTHVLCPSETNFASTTCTTLLQNMMHGLNSRNVTWLIGSSSGQWAFTLHRNFFNTSFVVSVSVQVSCHGKALQFTNNGSLQVLDECVAIRAAISDRSSGIAVRNFCRLTREMCSRHFRACML